MARSIRLGIALLSPVLLGGGCAADPSRPETAAFAIPHSSLQLAVERIPTHPTLSEYDRVLVLRSRAGEVVRVTLFRDTGGYSRVNLYRLADSSYLARDAESSYLIRPPVQAITRDSARRVADSGRYLGAFAEDRDRTWRFIPAEEGPELPTEFRGG